MIDGEKVELTKTYTFIITSCEHTNGVTYIEYEYKYEYV